LSAIKNKVQVMYDVIVVGSGAGGLTAAVTAKKQGLDVLVLEKEKYYGGTTARSGGVLWIPCNRHSRESGIVDSENAACTYLRYELGPFFDTARVEAFLQNGPRMVDFLERETGVKFVAIPEFPDYHPGAPGGCSGGRSILTAPFDGRKLGERVNELRPPLRAITFVGMMFSASQDVQHFFNVTRSLTSAIYVARRLARHAREILIHGRAMSLTNGNALVASLAKSAFDLGISLWVSSPVRELIREDDVICGVVAETRDGSVRLRARRGVVLAAGGFSRDAVRWKTLFADAAVGAEHLTTAPPGNTGDGLRLAESVGGQIALEFTDAAAWVPVSRIVRRDGDVDVFPHLIDRYKPGVIAVTRHGERFVNEANSYHDFGQALREACNNESEVTAYLVCDHRAIRRYGLGFVKPFPVPLFQHLRSGYLLRGRTVTELANRAGIAAAALGRTIANFNVGARQGNDPEYGKGTTAYNRYLGDAQHNPNPCVAPLDRGPYYAIKVVLGDLGTFAGIRTDRYARVLDAAGQPVAGLYAVGNDAASIMGGNYPAGGIILGPAMTFGYIAGRHLAGVSDSSPP
jgi:succinate dehydrogenase/fumarate reductase flavoprotein subunit